MYKSIHTDGASFPNLVQDPKILLTIPLPYYPYPLYMFSRNKHTYTSTIDM